MYESIQTNTNPQSVNKRTKLYETVKFIKTYGNVRFRTFSYILLFEEAKKSISINAVKKTLFLSIIKFPVNSTICN